MGVVDFGETVEGVDESEGQFEVLVDQVMQA